MDRELRRKERDGRLTELDLMRAGRLDPIQALLNQLVGRYEVLTVLAENWNATPMTQTLTIRGTAEIGFIPYVEVRAIGASMTTDYGMVRPLRLDPREILRRGVQDRFYGPARVAQAIRHEICHKLLYNFSAEAQELIHRAGVFVGMSSPMQTYIDELITLDKRGVPLAKIWRHCGSA